MSNVFANGRTVSAKGDGNKSIAAMADVCLSPPSPPAGPIPIPYPNFSEASDTSDGTKTVQVGGQEVGKKNSSNYKTSKGDEAATKSLGMGVVTHQIQGKTYHAAWSMDVKVEGENVIRHLDLTTHNHASQPFNLAGTIDVKDMAPSPTGEDCNELEEKNNKARDDWEKAQKKTKKGRRAHKTKRKISRENTTITHAKFKCPGGKTAGLKACSRNVATRFKGEGWVKGVGTGKPGTINRKSAVRCEAAKARGFRYRATTGAGGELPHTSHTESRLLEHTMAEAAAQGRSTAGCTMLMAINWNKSDPPDDNPCEHCKRVICAAQACGMNILLCQGDPGQKKPQPPPECKENLG